MKKFIMTMIVLGVMALAGPNAFAQQTTGSITGRIVDAQGAAVPGVTVTGKNTQTGFTRVDVSDAEGIYRLNALPVGTYDLLAELQGFSKVENKGIVLNVGQTLDVALTMKVANMEETVTVTGESPLIETRSSSVGGVVDVARIENLPLNGRQFANLAATLPGVGLGFHSDPTKSSQFSPQVNGGNGRNVNYQIDGGDNNDDTVGGLLQNFPLEAIQEFNFVTQRFKAEYGRSNGGVMNIVTKSGTNAYSGSAFSLFRDKSLNARTHSEKDADSPKADYRRYQFGGSFGGPILQNRAFYFAAVERTQQDTNQQVDTRGLFPDQDGVYKTPIRETLFNVKQTTTLNAAQYLAVRYGRNSNSQPYGAGLRFAPSSWSTSENKFNSINVNHNWVLGGSRLNEFIFQYANFSNAIPLSSPAPYELFPNTVTIGANPNTPQATEQTKWQFRDDFSWSLTGLGGLGHDMKAGVNFINEPHLYATFNSGVDDYQYTHLTDDRNGPIQTITRNGGVGDVNIPFKQYAAYVQDDWRVSDRLTLNLGLRYDLVKGVQIDQSKNPNFVALQAAGAAGRFTGIPLMEDFGQSPKDDTNNLQPRIGFAYDIRGNGRDVIRGGWGVYQDFGYTNANVLFPAIDASGQGHGAIFSINKPAGIVKPDGTFFKVGDPISSIESQNEADPTRLPLFGQVVSPRLQQPYTRQTNIGLSHQLGDSTAITADYVHIDGRDLNIRFRYNYLDPATGLRRLAGLDVRPNTQAFRAAVSGATSTYDALILGARRRMTRGVDFSVSYTLAKASSDIGAASDELDANYIQNVLDPFADVQHGPSGRTDARHRVSASAVIMAPWGIQVAPFFIFRSALPIFTFEGVDLNGDGNNNDITARAYQYDGLGKAPKEIGDCKTVNCSRGSSTSQLNLRVSKSFTLVGHTRIEAIGEVFNVLNALNPAFPLTSQRLAGGVQRAAFMQPTAFAGDFRQPEQRVGQVGFRFSF
ncbi:MAG TPA: TonB-dependent receptor [Vicinamibacterales bacterium]